MAVFALCCFTKLFFKVFVCSSTASKEVKLNMYIEAEIQLANGVHDMMPVRADTTLVKATNNSVSSVL